jgi:MFS family permease
VAELRPTPVMVTLVPVATSLPVLLFALPAGAIGDAFDRRRLLILLQMNRVRVQISTVCGGDGG